MSLFEGIPGDLQYGRAENSADLRQRPLAERMRPRSLEEFAGQEHLVGPGKSLRMQLENDDATSMILWGPPGVGKTTVAKIIAQTTQSTFIEFSAVVSGIKEIKQVMADADSAASAGVRTILFVDEIHRFNRSQQDAFLPYVERGAIRLIGATTENPSFELNAALLSRCRVYVLEPLSDEQVLRLLRNALSDTERGLGGFGITADKEVLNLIASYANGDVRRAYNALEAVTRLAVSRQQPQLNSTLAMDALQQKALIYDKSGEEHYNLISALHKSVRNSDPDAALYWLARMLRSGEDPMYLARRLVRMASEDIGLAAPEALNLALSARDAMEFLGSPEGDLALAQATVYLALAPKSNALYTALSAVVQDVEQTRAEPVPLHLRNAPTSLMESLDYGKGYRYAHDEEGAVSDMECLPPGLLNTTYYHPTDRGREKQLQQRIEELARLRSRKRP
ncbi:MAG TPA: replication-associated recombination protein A [Acidobacteriaceae bacterium]|nr:replication-associated recombination protein A [Acidobacteriaceae bacterium]